jgi:uncharacterized protein YcnI
VRLTLLLLAAALALPVAATAHVTIAPPFVDAGVATEISMTVPNERPPHATVALEATMPTGISIVSANAPPGWIATVDGSTVTWSGGRITGRNEVVFPVRIKAVVRAGTYGVAARQRYDDGAEVRWTSDLSVLPAPGDAAPVERPWPAIAAAIVGIVVIGGSLLVLRRLRR